MTIKEFKQLSRQNNYYVLQRGMQLQLHSHPTLHQIMFAKQVDTLVIKRGSKVYALIPLTKKRNIAEFTDYPPKVSKSEFNLIKEFTNNAISD